VLQHVHPQSAQRGVVDTVRGQRNGHHGYVIDTLRLDQRHRHAGRDLVEIGLQLVVHLDDRGPQLFADQEAHCHHGTTAFGSRIHVPHTGNLVHDPFQRFGHQAGDLSRRSAGILDEYVDHGHRDLRVFLTRREHQTQQTDRQCGHHQQRGNRGIDKGAGQPAGDAQ